LGLFLVVGAVFLIIVLSYTGAIPWSDFAPALATTIVGAIPIGIGLIAKKRISSWLRGKARPTMYAEPPNMTAEQKAAWPPKTTAEKWKINSDLVVNFFIGGFLALFGWYVVRLIFEAIPTTIKVPWTFILIPYTLLVVGFVLLGLGIVSVITYLRK